MIAPLTPHQSRVVEEHRQLVGRLDRLRAFLASQSDIPDAERGRLAQQAAVMQIYVNILAERIAAFTP